MKIKINYIRFIVFLIVTAICCNISVITVNADYTGPYNIILSWTGDTTDSVTVTWNSSISSGDNYVMFGEDKSLRNASRADAISVEVKSGISIDTYIYKAVLTDLNSGTIYYYRICESGGQSETESFITDEDNSDSFSFMYMGDIQVASSTQKDYDDWGILLDNALKRNPGLAFGMLGGDIVESGIDAVQWNAFLKNASPFFSKIPLMSTNGNHESNFPGGKPELYLDVFSLPENGPDGFKEEFYSFDYGNCHITVLNSWVFSGEQKLTDDDYSRISKWIENDIFSSNATWKIVVMHHPIYSLTSDNVADAVKKNWEPIFLNGGVSLVFCGHQHVYNRSYPMNDDKIDYENGITYIMGNAGEKFYSDADERYSEKTIYNTSTYQIIQIDNNNLTVRTFDGEGSELDYCLISPRIAAVTSNVFEDVSENAWYTDAVKYVTNRNLMTGTSVFVFSPDSTLTRAMFATVLYRMAGTPSTDNVQTVKFNDVSSGEWYHNSVVWAANEEIIKGYGVGLFGKDDAITREQMAVILYRYSIYMGLDIKASGELSSFSDAERVSDWAKTAMSWAVGSGLINGLPDGTLSPRTLITRAQCAMILMRYGGNI